MEGFPGGGFGGMDLSSMMDPSMLMQFLMDRNSETRHEARQSDKVKCPVCTKKHRPKEDDRCKVSHGALEIYCEAPCPVCLEDTMGPPMVALPCGHIICPQDFQSLGGKYQDVSDVEASSSSEDETGDDARDALIRHLMESGIFPGMPGGMGGGRGPRGGGPDIEELDSDDYDSMYDDDEGNEGGSHGSMPPLEHDSEDSNDGAGRRRRRRRRGQQSGGRRSRRNRRQQRRSGGDSDSDDSMPPLETRDGQVQQQRRGRGGDSGSEGSMPPLVARNGRDVVDSDSDDSMDMPPLAGRGTGEDSSSSDSSDDSLPPLQDRSGAPRGSSARSSARDSDEESMPDLISRPSGESSSSDDESSTGSMPTLRPISNRSATTSRQAGSSAPRADPQADGDSDDSVPPLATRRNKPGDSDSSSYSDDSDNPMPGLDRKNYYETDDSEEDSLPPLMTRDDSAASASTKPKKKKAKFDSSDNAEGVCILEPRSNRKLALMFAKLSGDVASSGEEFPDSSKLVPSSHLVLVCSPSHGHADVLAVTPSARRYPSTKYEIPNNAQVVSDCHGGIWTLSLRSAGTAASNLEKDLHYFNSQNEDGKFVKYLPRDSQLYQDSTGGCWVHVKEDPSGNYAGLWQCSIMAQKKVMELRANVRIAHDGNGGLWILSPADGNQQSSLMHLDADASRSNHRVDCDFTKDTKLIASNKGGVLIHCRKEREWALFYFTAPSTMKKLYVCPKDVKVVSDKEGNAWVMQKNKKARELMVVSMNGKAVKHRKELTAGSIFCGI